MQKVLEAHPAILAYPLSSGGEAWVIPQQRFGSHYIADFLVGFFSSAMINWVAVEIESPAATLLDSKGYPSSAVNHANFQIAEWRKWIEKNLDSSRRDPRDKGLGLTGISGDLEGYVIIGRRDERDEWQERREQAESLHKLKIRSYDWLLEAAQSSLKTFTR